MTATETVRVAWPRQGGKVHRVDVSEYEGVVDTACGRQVKVRTGAWEGEPPFVIRDMEHDRFMADIDTCERCKRVVRAGR